jgi:hypothetical protein
MSSEMETNLSHENGSVLEKTTHQSQGASVGMPRTGQHQNKTPIVYTGKNEGRGPRPQAVALTSWQSYALGLLAFSSVLTMLFMIVVLAMAVRLGQTVEVVPWADGHVHILRAAPPQEW